MNMLPPDVRLVVSWLVVSWKSLVADWSLDYLMKVVDEEIGTHESHLSAGTQKICKEAN